MTDKKEASLRSFDKREAQRKSLKEKEMEEATRHAELVNPEIYYEDEKVNDIQIWLETLEHNSTIYVGPFVSKDGKDSSIGLRYTIDNLKTAKISNNSEDEIISDWRIGMMERIIVKHNKLNNGIIILKIFSLKSIPNDDRVKKTLYIPMSRITHIVTNENMYNKDMIQR